jgi:ketosteroid isomerase-like protein
MVGFMPEPANALGMSSNKKLIETYQASLGNLDWAAVASCLTDDVERVEWADGFPSSGVPVRGKAAVIKDMEAPRRFQIQATRMTEENNVVVAECVVRVPLEKGGYFVGRALSVYELENGKIKRMTSFVAEDKKAT